MLVCQLHRVYGRCSSFKKRVMSVDCISSERRPSRTKTDVLANILAARLSLEIFKVRPPNIDIKGSRMPKKVLVALPPGLLEQIDFVAQVEHRTRSDLIREALRRYIESFKRTQGPRMSVSTVGQNKVAILTESE